MLQEIFYDMKETLGDSAPAYSIVTKWHAQFKRGRSSCDDFHPCGWPATSVNKETVGKVNKLDMNDWRLSVCFIAESVGISTSRVHSTLTQNLLTKKVSARWVPRMLCDAQKANRVDASTSLLRLFNENPDNFISRLLTLDETQLQHFDLEVKCNVWRGTCLFSTSEKVLRCRVGSQSYATVFWDAEGIVRIDYIEHDSTITGIYYTALIRKVWAALNEKRQGNLHHRVGVSVSPGQRTCSHVISSTGCHSKCRIRTTPSPTVFVRLGPKRLLFVS